MVSTFCLQCFDAVGWLGIRPVINWVVGCWLSVWDEVQISIWPRFVLLPGFTFLVPAHPSSQDKIQKSRKMIVVVLWLAQIHYNAGNLIRKRHCKLANFCVVEFAVCWVVVCRSNFFVLLSERNIHLDHLLVVCPQSVSWRNGLLDPSAVWGGHRWGQLSNGCVDHWREGAVLGCPIVNNGALLHCCVDVREPIDAVVWGGEWSGPRHWCIRWGYTCLKRKGLLLGFFDICTPIHLDRQNDVLFAEICIRLVWKVENISVWTRYCWKRRFIGFLMILSGSRSKWGFRTKLLQKCNSWHTQNRRSAATII